jgi:hypothetical protein
MSVGWLVGWLVVGFVVRNFVRVVLKHGIIRSFPFSIDEG